MLNDILQLNKKHEHAAQTILEKVRVERKSKYIITISGEVETGKSEIAHYLGQQMKKEGIRAKILHMDNYYIVPPNEREAWRKANGIEHVGEEEYNWDLIHQHIEAFKKGRKAELPCVDLFTGQVDTLSTSFRDIDLLIIEGLYSIRIEESDLRIFIEQTYKDTIAEQIIARKEELNDFRMQVLEKEHTVVQSLKDLGQFFIDFDTSREIMHY